MLLGLLEPTSGSITLFDQDFIRDRYSVLSRMNFSSPYVDLPQRLTVRENLTVYAKLYGICEVKEELNRFVRNFDLAKCLIEKSENSHRVRKPMSLAKALINRPRFLLLDEPSQS